MNLVALVAFLPIPAEAYINAGFKSQVEADAYYKRQRDAKAREAANQLAVLDEAIRRDPADAVALYQRGKFLSQSKPQQALKDFDEAIRLNPKFSQALFRRSCVRASQQDFAGCAADLEEWMKLEPAAVDASFRLAVLRYTSSDESLRDLRRARDLAQPLCEGKPGPEQRHLELRAAICADMGDFDAAVKWESRIWEAMPDAIPADSRLNAYRRGETVSSVGHNLKSVPANIPLN